MGSKRSIFSLVVMVSFSSIAGAQDFAQFGGVQQFGFGENRSVQGKPVVSSVSNVFDDETPTDSSQDEAESASVQRADFIVLMGLGGFLAAGIAATAICLILRKRAESNGGRPVPLVFEATR